MEQETSGPVPPSGLHGIFEGVLYPLRFHKGGWAFRSDHPAAGFTADGDVLVRMIAADDHVECFGFRHTGTYRGLEVAVLPRPDGDLVLVSTDKTATDQGFTAHELRRGGTDWRTTVRAGDPGLSVRSVRRPLPVPWADNPEEVLPPRGGDRSAAAPGARPDGPARGLSPSAFRKNGLYAQRGSAEYRLVRQRDGWVLHTDRPEDGFTHRHDRYVRAVAPDEHLECFTLAHTGVFHGLVVRVDPGNAGLVQLSTRDRRALEDGFIPFGFERREIQEYVRTVAVDDPGLSITTTRTPVPAPWTQDAPRAAGTTIPPSWGAFTHALAETLRDVSDRTYLVVMSASDPRRYVQLAGGPSLLHAEAPGTDVVADADEDALHAADWAPPGPAQPSWTWELEQPAAGAELTALAERCVKALRHAYGISGPSALVYRAWRDPETMLPGETWSAERMETYDRGSSALALPSLGLPAV